MSLSVLLALNHRYQASATSSATAAVAADDDEDGGGDAMASTVEQVLRLLRLSLTDSQTVRRLMLALLSTHGLLHCFTALCSRLAVQVPYSLCLFHCLCV